MRCKACNSRIEIWFRKSGGFEDLCTKCLNEVKDTLQWMDYCKETYGDSSVIESQLTRMFLTDYAEEHTELKEEDEVRLDRNADPEAIGDDTSW